MGSIIYLLSTLPLTSSCFLFCLRPLVFLFLAGPLLSQGFCTGCCICLVHSSLRYQHSSFHFLMRSTLITYRKTAALAPYPHSPLTAFFFFQKHLSRLTYFRVSVFILLVAYCLSLPTRLYAHSKDKHFCCSWINPST